MNFTANYLAGNPVIVRRPDGTELLVVGFVGRPDGVSFADDAILDDWLSGHHPLHHLTGEVTSVGEEIACQGHEFRTAYTDEQYQLWQRAMQGRDVNALRRRTERKLRLDLYYRDK